MISFIKHIDGLNETKVSLRNFEKLVKIRVAQTLGSIAVHLLASAQPRVPYDTGLLRESGQAIVILSNKHILVGEGDENGTIHPILGNLMGRNYQSIQTMKAEVRYSRAGENGFDIAQWTHEKLKMWTSQNTPAARYPGTGPKYLEDPWKENKAKYLNFIKESLSTNKLVGDIEITSQIRRRKRGKYTVDFRKINPNMGNLKIKGIN